MSSFRDLTGQRFGRLTALRQAENRRGRTAWLCRCDCGVERVVVGFELAQGDTRSCGCLMREMTASLNRTHGKTRTGAWNSYALAKARCTNRNNPRFCDYGGRGIKFLFTSFEEFYAELGERPLGLTLGRIDNAGHYKPGNVKWEPWLAQANNARTNRPLTAFGITHNLSTWVRMLNARYATLHHRLKKQSPEQALSHVRIPPGTFWVMETVPAAETYSATDSWEWKRYVPYPDVRWETLEWDTLEVRQYGITNAALSFGM